MLSAITNVSKPLLLQLFGPYIFHNNRINQRRYFVIHRKLSFENKELYLLDDNIDEYYNIISSNFLVPHITLTTRITSTSRSLIDNQSLITYLGGIKG